MDEADHAFGRVEAEHGASPGPVERLGSPPVGREPSRGRPEQDRVDGARRRMQVLGVGARVAATQERSRQHERRGTTELYGLLLAAGLLEACPRLGAERASSSSDRNVSSSTGVEAYCLCVRRRRIASSTSIGQTLPA